MGRGQDVLTHLHLGAIGVAGAQHVVNLLMLACRGIWIVALQKPDAQVGLHCDSQPLDLCE